ncbi:MAG: hypothetical protein JXJ04_25400 [Spirochaetales bacterium]|nr:hypothetical protein [Spirochaetales bacterium]
MTFIQFFLLVISIFVLLLSVGCPIPNSSTHPADPTPQTSPPPLVTPGPTDGGTPEPTDVPTEEPTPEITGEPTIGPTTASTEVPSTIRELITPLLENAAMEINVNDCADPEIPFLEDMNGYNIYITGIQRDSTSVECTGDENVIEFSTSFYNFRGDLLFDCNGAGLCTIFSVTSAIFTTDFLNVTGTINCTIDINGDFVDYHFSDIVLSVQNFDIDTDNDFVDGFIGDYLKPNGIGYFPCIQVLVANTFSGVIDSFIGE